VRMPTAATLSPEVHKRRAAMSMTTTEAAYRRDGRIEAALLTWARTRSAL
jgi:hypothetical protein